MIVIVDYGMANLRSVQKAFERIGHPTVITSDPNRVAEAAKLVLPGVGAFRDGIARLRDTGLDQSVTDFIHRGKPFLGICLGMQLLFTKSFEDGEHAGLNVLPGSVVRLDEKAGVKVPHMGWNQLRVRRPSPILEGIAPDSAVYFVHSYYAVPEDSTLIATETDYPRPFVSAVWRDNVFATQFHPEKSQGVGLRMLHNFARLS